jgi:hypothetical protein
MTEPSTQLTLNLLPRIVPDAADCIWAAGFFDGEGCVNLTTGLSRGAKNPTVKAQILLTNTDRQVLDWYQERWGGAVYVHAKLRSDGDHGHRRTAYVWCLFAAGRLKFLQDITPHLKVKQPQADNCVAFLEMRDKRGPVRGRAYTESQRVEDRIFLDRHKSLDLTRGGQKAHRPSVEVLAALGSDAPKHLGRPGSIRLAQMQTPAEEASGA